MMSFSQVVTRSGVIVQMTLCAFSLSERKVLNEKYNAIYCIYSERSCMEFPQRT